MKKRKRKPRRTKQQLIEAILAELEQKQLLFAQKTIFNLTGAT